MAEQAGHLKLLVLVTLFVGVAAFGASFLLPKVYTSAAYLGPMDDSSARDAQAVIRTPAVLDSVIGKFPDYLSGRSLDQKRNSLNSNLYWQMLSGSDFKSAVYSLSLDDSDPHRAQGLLNAIVDSWLETKRPRPDKSFWLEKALEASQAQAVGLSRVIAEFEKRPDAMFADARNGYFPPNIVDMIRMRAETAGKIVDLTMELRAGSRDLVFSPATLPQDPSSWSRMRFVLGSIVLTFIVLLAFFLFRWYLRRVFAKPAYAPMIGRLRRALPWQR